MFKLFGNKKKRFTHRHTVVVNSIPKSGTNLLLNTVTSIPNSSRKGDCSYTQRYFEPDSKFDYIMTKIRELKPGFVYSGHIPYFERYDQWLKDNDIRQIFIYRDPRAIVISGFYYIMEMKKEKQVNYELLKNGTTNEDKVLDLIYGIGEGKNMLKAGEKDLAGIRHVFEGYLPWLSNERTLCIKYEDLVSNGPLCTEKILAFLGFNDTFELSQAAAIFERGANPDRSHTYRKGGTEEWKKEFNSERQKAFLEVMPASLMNAYGYNL
jgi:hypothetical protein